MKWLEPTKTPPNISIIDILLQNLLEIFNSLVEILLGAKNAAYRTHRGNGSGVGPQRKLVSGHGLVEIVQ